jgi:hypothetical protein
MTWEDHFSNIILERGYDYYIHKHVASVKEIEGGFEAVVSGSDDYTVQILFEEESITEMDCTCPYADDGSLCKHMAAVMYKIEEENGTRKEIDLEDMYTGIPVSESEKVGNIVSKMDADDVRTLLISILNSDGKLRNEFLAKYKRNDNNIIPYINNLRHTARAIQCECSDWHGFVDWRNVSGFVSRLINEVITTLRDFVSGEYDEDKAAFDVSLYVFDLYANTAIDDDGDTQVLTAACLDFWEYILVSSDSDDLARYMLDQLSSECEKIGLGEYMAIEVDDFIADHFNEAGFAATRLETIDARIERYESEESWHGYRELSDNVIERLQIMESLGAPSNDIESFQKQYWRLPAVREAEMAKLEAAGKTVELIQLIMESKELDRESPGLLSKYSRKLIEYYKENNDPESVKKELFQYITEYKRGDTEALSELKQYYEEAEWVEKREEIFAALAKSGVDLKPLFAAEKLTDRLFELLKNDKRMEKGYEKFAIWEVAKYEDVLRVDYNDDLLDIYEKLLWAMSDFAGGRSHYKELVAGARRMLKYNGGKDRVRKLLESWRFAYDNRPAMQDELQVLYRLI